MAALINRIRIVSWNINNVYSRSLGNKLETDEVKKILNDHDIVCLVETHAKKGEQLTLPGFKKPFRIDRPSKGKKAFGGIAVFVKEYLWKVAKICPMKTKNENTLWLKISGKDKGYRDIYLGSTYLSPENKKNRVHLKTCMANLREDVELFSSRGSIFLLGDFNARTNRANDFVQDLDPMYEEEIEPHTDKFDIKIGSMYSKFDELGEVEAAESRLRNSQDNAPLSKRGKELISLCKDLELSILNGRKLGDVFGKITCFRSNGCSVVDYGICSKDLFDAIPHFSVGLHMPWVSDHCPIVSILPFSGMDRLPEKKSSYQNCHLNLYGMTIPENVSKVH